MAYGFCLVVMLTLLPAECIAYTVGKIVEPDWKLNFGPSRFDKNCEYTYKPNTAVQKRQSTQNHRVARITEGDEQVQESHNRLNSSNSSSENDKQV
jgi:hypothetical protein